MTPLFVGAAWREAVETAVCVNEKVYWVQCTGQRIRTLMFTGVTTMDDQVTARARRVLNIYSYITVQVNSVHAMTVWRKQYGPLPRA